MGLEPTTLYTLDRALYQLSYRGSSAGWAQISHVHAQVIIDNWKYVVEETYLGIISIKPLVLVATLKVTSVVSTISFHVRHVYDHTSQLVALAVSHSQSRFLLSNTLSMITKFCTGMSRHNCMYMYVYIPQLELQKDSS